MKPARRTASEKLADPQHTSMTVQVSWFELRSGLGGEASHRGHSLPGCAL